MRSLPSSLRQLAAALCRCARRALQQLAHAGLGHQHVERGLTSYRLGSSRGAAARRHLRPPPRRIRRRPRPSRAPIAWRARHRARARRAACSKHSISRNTYAGPLPEIAVTASMWRSSSSHATVPTADSSSPHNARCAEADRGVGDQRGHALADRGRRVRHCTHDGRTGGKRAPISAIVLPAAIDKNTARRGRAHCGSTPAS